MKKKYIYDITLVNGEFLQNIGIKGRSLQSYNGIGANFVPVEDSNGKTVVLSKYQIVKAELVNIEE